MSRRLRVLYVAYPLLTVSEESAGGAEQVLWTLEREMASGGAVTAVAASRGSRVSGELLATGDPCRQLDDYERRNQEHQRRVVEFVRTRTHAGEAFDLVHDMSGSFWTRANQIDIPLLATLHLPRNFYSPKFFDDIAANVTFNCVSQSQAQSFADLETLLGVVNNGIALDLLPPRPAPRHGLLWLGRICEEKAPHLALEIAAQAGMLLTIAGQVYPFSYHRQYFDREIAPRLQQPNVKFMESPTAAQKRRLLQGARAVLITSQVEETSSLVAMEAAASGTPVISFARGALPEIVRDGVTGFLVDRAEDAMRALQRINQIDHAVCVRHASKYFSGTRMAQEYCQLYWQAHRRNITVDQKAIRAV